MGSGSARRVQRLTHLQEVVLSNFGTGWCEEKSLAEELHNKRPNYLDPFGVELYQLAVDELLELGILGSSSGYVYIARIPA